MVPWHRLGAKDALLARVPFALKIERHRIAVFVHDGRFTAISDVCNHKGGPLSEGRVQGEFVTCPWHGWEYSVVTGKGPAGYDEEQVTEVLIKHKVGAFIITGGQDNIQGVAGSMFTFWSELGFLFPQFPFIAHSRGWDAEEMQNNVRQVKASDALRQASRELVERAVDFWKVLDQHRAVMDKPMERAGRKANPLAAAEAER